MVKTIVPDQMFRGFSTVGRNFGDYKLSDLELVKRDLLNEFYTPKGSRRRNVNFGSIVWELIFEPLTPGISELIEDDIRRIVSNDPRLDLEEILVDQINQGFVVIVTLFYRPTQTIEQFTATFDQKMLAESVS